MSAEWDIPEVLIAYQDDPQLHRSLGEARPPTGAELGRRAERIEADRIAGSALTLAIVPAGAEQCCGEIRVHDVDWARSVARLSVWTAPAVRGRGLARRAVLLVREWLWRECGLDVTP